MGHHRQSASTDASPPDRGLSRQEFIRLAAGIIAGLGIPGIPDGDSGGRRSSGKAELDESYLAKGLAGMARAQGWFDAHWGAAVIAGYYLCRENSLGEETVVGIEKQLDAMIHTRASQFTPLPESPADDASIERIPAALAPALEGGLRAHGHAAIFAALAIRALGDVPRLAQRELIEKLCGLSRQIARHAPEKPRDARPYSDTQTMIEAVFDSLARFQDVVGRPSVRRPNFTHMVTHTEALVRLEALDYRDLARCGHAGHRSHIDVPVPDFDPEDHPLVETPASLDGIVNATFWRDERNTERWSREWGIPENPNGNWVASGHLFKVLYAYQRLAARIEDPDKVRLCSRVLLERYFNPDVQGG